MALWWIRGPAVEAGSKPLPSLNCDIFCFRVSRKVGRMPSCTKMRFAETQVCPVARSLEVNVPVC